MKELTGTALNYVTLGDSKDDRRSQVEIILIVSEPVYRLTNAKEMSKERETSTLRFSTDIHGIEVLMKTLTEIKSELEDMQRLYDITIKKETP